MKYLIVIIILALFVGSCTDGTKKPAAEPSNESDRTVVPDSIPAPGSDSVAAVKPQSETYALVSQSKQVLAALKKNDLKQFASFIHPTLGARFSPYGYIDTTLHRTFSPQQLVNTSLSGKKMFWGYYDGSGDSINLNVADYFKRFVYNIDFLSTGRLSVNQVIGSGNSLNNLQTVYKDAAFTEIHIPGVNPKYGGMDWCSLRLVYRKVGTKLYLVAVVHDQWTI